MIAQPDGKGKCVPERVTAGWPWAQVITPGNNLGCAVANKLGVASASDADVINFLNPDTKSTEVWATPLTDALIDLRVEG